MQKVVKIGNKEFVSKKAAIAHYRAILNSYEFGQSLNDADFDDLMDLLNYNPNAKENEISEMGSCDENSPLSERDREAIRMWNSIVERGEINLIEDFLFSKIWKREKGFAPWFEAFNWPYEKIEKIKNLIDNGQIDVEEHSSYVSDIKVSKVQFNTKCFEVFRENGESCYISYIQIINNKYYSNADLFRAACRSAVNADIHSVKSRYFKDSKNRMVKCQETGIPSKWDELVVDHRQPNTFSVIVDRFKEINRVDLDAIEYTSNCKNNIVFVDTALSEKFRQYHSQKANLRIVRRERNAGRSGLARVKRSSKDLFISN